MKIESFHWKALILFANLFFLARSVQAQPATIQGHVFDQSGAVVPGASVTLSRQGRPTEKMIAGKDGAFSFRNIPVGSYSLIVTAPRLEQVEALQLSVGPGLRTVRIELRVAAVKQEATVQDTAEGTLSTESANNASALVLRNKDLDALGEDPEDLSSDLEALAGPSPGPGGSSLYIDGFSGGQLPAKDAIREVRINQNPFAPEYDKLGLGRIEILTKPGADKYHSTSYFNFGESIWNSRNPYAAEKAPFLLKEYGTSVEGPLGKQASFFLTIDRAAIDNGAIINGTTVDSAKLTIVDPFTQVLTVPQRRVRVSPRVDYQLTPTDTLSFRYAFSTADIQHSGVGSFNLASTGIHNSGTDQTGQIGNTLVLGPSTLNETRFQFYRAHIMSVAEDISPQINVLNSFVGGGAQVGRSINTLSSYEFQNYTTQSHQAHTFRYGVRLRTGFLDNDSPINFGGTFTFGGRIAPVLSAAGTPILDASGNEVLANINSIEAYRRTLLFQRQGLSSALIRALGGGASQVSINAGNPFTSATQVDLGAFVGDTRQIASQLTVAIGLRYEWQTHLRDYRDFAPRAGLAWGIGGKNSKTVLRAGLGFFYQRFDLIDVLDAERFNGLVQQQYVLNNPNFYPNIPDPSLLPGSSTPQTMEQLSPGLRAPYLINSAVSIERQLPKHTTASVSYVRSHGVHQFLTTDINAPLPGTYNPSVPESGVYPMGRPGPVFEVMSSGRYNQNELITTVNSKWSDNVSVFGIYVFNRARSDTDYSPPPLNEDFNPAISGGGVGVGTFPANPYSRTGEYGPASTDIHHQVRLGGSLAARWGFRFSPLLTINSGAPFNITVGRDRYGTTLFNGRPSIATDATRPGLVPTSYGLLNPDPALGELMLPRNFGRGPMILLLNLRVSKAFTFGKISEASRAGGAAKGGRYTLTISLSTRNILNRNNPGPIVGDISSPLFGRANQPYGAGTFGGTGFSESADNRRLEWQTRFTF